MHNQRLVIAIDTKPGVIMLVVTTMMRMMMITMMRMIMMMMAAVLVMMVMVMVMHFWLVRMNKWQVFIRILAGWTSE